MLIFDYKATQPNKNGWVIFLCAIGEKVNKSTFPAGVAKNGIKNLVVILLPYFHGKMLPMESRRKVEAQMKKTFVVLSLVVVIGLIVFTLIHNKKVMEEQAAVNALSSYTVSVIPASKKELNSQLSQTGTILANNDVAIVSEVNGKVTAVMVSEGSWVQNGSPLLKVEDDIPEANFLAAKTNYQKAQKDYQSYQSLYSEGLISESDLDTARLAFKSAEAQYIGARKQYKNSVITSPIAGVVTARPVNVGTMVSKGRWWPT